MLPIPLCGQVTTECPGFPLHFREEIEALTKKCEELEEAKRQERDSFIAMTHDEVRCGRDVPSTSGMVGLVTISSCPSSPGSTHCLSPALMISVTWVMCVEASGWPWVSGNLDVVGAALRREAQKGEEEEQLTPREHRRGVHLVT